MTELYLHSLALHTPEKILSNDELSRSVDTSDEWIRSRTGIGSRHVLSDKENASDLGIAAAREALAQAQMLPSQLTHLVTATGTPDALSPSTACLIAAGIDAGRIMAFDLSAACSGFLYGLHVCRGLLCAEPQARILFVCTEALTRRLDWQDRTTCVLFGDGAGACVLSASPEGAIARLEDIICLSDGSKSDLIVVGGGTACRYTKGQPVDENFFLRMNGRETFRHAVRCMTSVCEELLKRNHLECADIDLFVAHQANSRILQAVGERFDLPPEKIFTNLDRFGNTSSASIPIALTEARHCGAIRKGDLVLTCAFGSGLTWGGALLRF